MFGTDNLSCNNKRIDEGEDTRAILNIIRGFENKVQKENILNEEKKEKNNAIAITDDIKFGQNVLSNQIESFRSAVDGGAEFSEANPDKVSESPLIFMPKTKNVIFSGTIPSMNNLEFQFVLKTTTGHGCFIWTEGLILSKENMKTLSKLQGYYENWKEEWNISSRELDSLKDME